MKNQTGRDIRAIIGQEGLNKFILPFVSIIKVVALNIGSLGIVFVTLFLMSKLPAKAEKIKELRNQKIVKNEQVDIAFLMAGLEGNKETLDFINTYFADEEGLLKFYLAIDELRREGTLQKFVPLSGTPVKSSNQAMGYPIAIELKGSRELVNTAYLKILNLPFLIRPITFKYEVLTEESAVRLSLGVMLYTNETD